MMASIGVASPCHGVEASACTAETRRAQRTTTALQPRYDQRAAETAAIPGRGEGTSGVMCMAVIGGGDYSPTTSRGLGKAPWK